MKHLLALMLFAVVATAQAQTYVGSGVILRTTDPEIRFINQPAFDGVVLQFGTYDTKTGTFNPMVDLADGIRAYGNIPTLYQYTSLAIGTTSYSIKMGEQYAMRYYLPESFRYARKGHNPYLNCCIKLAAIHGTGAVMGYFTIVRIPVNKEFCEEKMVYIHTGTGVPGFDFPYTPNGLNSNDITPTSAFEDLYYWEFDQNPTKANEKIHDKFLQEIDHFVLEFDFFD